MMVININFKIKLIFLQDFRNIIEILIKYNITKIYVVSSKMKLLPSYRGIMLAKAIKIKYPLVEIKVFDLFDFINLFSKKAYYSFNNKAFTQKNNQYLYLEEEKLQFYDNFNDKCNSEEIFPFLNKIKNNI